MPETQYGSDVREVENSLDFEEKGYYYCARVYYERSYTPAILNPIDMACPEESSFDVTEVVIDEVMQINGDFEEVSLNLNVLDKNLQEAIEQDASERAERG